MLYMMSDCDKCWETPCKCGWDYLEWDIRDLKEFQVMLTRVEKYKN